MTRDRERHKGEAKMSDLIEKIKSIPVVFGMDFAAELKRPSISCVDREKVLEVARQHQAEAVDEEELAILSTTLISVIADHMNNSQEPLRTKLCRHLRPHLKAQPDVPFDEKALIGKAIDMYGMIDTEQMWRTVNAMRFLNMSPSKF